MWAFLITLALLACFLLWVRAWQHGSRFALGLVVGAALALLASPALRALSAMEHFPVWAPALPFAVIALTLFGFGVLAWYWGEE